MSHPDHVLRRIPPIDALVDRFGHGELEAVPRPLLVESVRAVVAALRTRLTDPAGREEVEGFFTSGRFEREVTARLEAMLGRRHRSVINATGILLHTGLGRAPLAEEAIDAAADAARYAVVEVDPDTGERDLREVRIARLLCDLTGAEAATVVNNNAAAVLVCLRALAAGRRVIVSRGELVEIGGGFRMPAVMEESGCSLVEVGSTNRTYVADYDRAIDDRTGMLLKVHTSNFRVVGFTHEPSVAELAQLARARAVPFVYDLGSGLLRDVAVAPLEQEPTVASALAGGADLVTFSGDKLIGGPQAGMIVGRRDLIDRLRGSALFRAVRPGKLDLAALEATLLAWRRSQTAPPDLPLYRALARSIDELREQALTFAAQLCSIAGVRAEVVETAGFLGSGSAPVRHFRGMAVAVEWADASADELLGRLRRQRPPIFARIDEGRVLLELRAVFDDQMPLLKRLVTRLLNRETEPS